MSKTNHSTTSSGRLFSFKNILAVLLIVGGLLPIMWWGASPATPDSFYLPPDVLPTKPGQLIRQEQFQRGVPTGAEAWRILYSTTRSDGGLAVASAIVVLPSARQLPPQAIIAWAHGTTGIVEGCAPSVMKKPFANVPAFPALLDVNYGFVATDYVGLGTAGGHAYLAGDEAAHAVLDSLRAAKQLDAKRLSGSAFVWGHSQGGHTALWTGMIASDYAPDIAIKGVAAFAPASDLKALVSSSKSTTFGKVVSALLIMSQRDETTTSYVTGVSHWPVQDIASRCVGEIGTLFSAAETLLLPRNGPFSRDPLQGPLGTFLHDNTPKNPVPFPLLIAQGGMDDLVLPAIQNSYVGERCAEGQALGYRLYDQEDHISIVSADSPLTVDLLKWTADSLKGLVTASACNK